jgi:Cys-tRNA synthase (O-phospho-L-seryl-tRNA:Cys-tRNA synthase)
MDERQPRRACGKEVTNTNKRTGKNWGVILLKFKSSFFGNLTDACKFSAFYFNQLQLLTTFSKKISN